MTRKVLLCFALVLCEMVVISEAADNQQTAPLRVVIIPSSTEVRVREPFGMALRVENTTGTNQIIRVMTCSWYDAWQSSNTNVSWNVWVCTANARVNVTIPPGGAYTNQLQMYIYNLIPDQELPFRMSFTPFRSVQKLWSNEVKLHILPPDAWQRGGQYYRDRNHDGKIDWEVSGTTWMGHEVYPFKMVTNSSGTVMATLEVTGQGVDTYKVDTNFDGFYDLEYGAGGTNGQIQWTTNIHERVPVAGKGFVPVEKNAWMDYWMPK